LRRFLSRQLWWIPVLAFAAAGASALDERTGIPAWRRLRHDLTAAHARIEVLRGDIGALRGEVDALETDSFAVERAIREDLGLALPGETVVRLDARRAGPGERRSDGANRAARHAKPGWFSDGDRRP
jgi:cell division protein FtsB